MTHRFFRLSFLAFLALCLCANLLSWSTAPLDLAQHVKMAMNLAGLCSEVVGLIFDMVDSKSLLRTLMVGNAILNSKIKRSLRYFSHAIDYRTRFARWPNFSAFPALEHVSVQSKDPIRDLSAACIYEVDLLALPSTLRTLDLGFYNSYLCLVELPPLTYTGGPFTPRLRQDLKNHFKHLKSVACSEQYIPEDWNMRRFGWLGSHAGFLGTTSAHVPI